MYEDKAWYGILDAEWFFTSEEDDVQERFANRFRGRCGLGYRLNAASHTDFLMQTPLYSIAYVCRKVKLAMAC